MQTGSTPDIPAQVARVTEKLPPNDETSISLNGDIETTAASTIVNNQSSEKQSINLEEPQDSFNEPRPGGTAEELLKASSEISSSNNSPTPSLSSATIGRKSRSMACEMCNNYETQLQEIQYRERLLNHQITTHESTIKRLKEDLKKEQQFCENLEEKYTEEQKQMETEIEKLSVSVDESQQTIFQLTLKYNKFEKRTTDIISGLIDQAGSLEKKLDQVTKDNEMLLGKNLIKSEQMLAEEISIPQQPEEMQLYCLNLREELIRALVQKESIEDKLKSKNLLLKEQLRSEQSSKDQLIEHYNVENENLKTQFEKLKRDFGDLLKRNQKVEKEYSNIKGKHQELEKSDGLRISELELQNQELSAYKKKAESDLIQLRNKLSSLQTELDNSEVVQRDFVKLSQSLQVQLEEIRQATTEVRWQHFDDVGECNSCKRGLNSKKEKTNCSHCGRIFCVECCSKVVHCGPNNRPFNVCIVCNTLLDKEGACWFAEQAPSSPT